MPMHPTGAAVVLAAVTLALTAASPRPAEAFIFFPMFQNQPATTDNRQGRSPTDNRWRDDTGKPVKPSTATKPRDDDSKSSSTAKGAKSTTKSDVKANSGQTSRSRSAKQEPAASKSSGRASPSAQRAKPGGTGATTAAQEASPTTSAASPPPQEASSADTGSNVGDIFDEKLGEVFKARIDELLKQPPK